MTYLHIYTGREAEEQVECLKPVLWHIALRKGECPECRRKVYLEMLEFGYCYWCLSCMVAYNMPTLGLGPQDIWRSEPNEHYVILWLRRRAYQNACYQVDFYGRDRTTGRFVKLPKYNDFAHWSLRQGILALKKKEERA